MKAIWKYYVGPGDGRYEVIMPVRSEVIAVMEQGGQLHVWAEVNIAASGKSEPKPRVFYVVGTGCPVPPKANTYLGSAICGPYVWHVYSGEAV